MSKQLLRSFAGGEITPELAGRLDLVKYQTGLATARNVITLPHGPAARRPGFEFISRARYTNRKVRLIPFSFSADQTAVLEFGHEYIRVFINGGAQLEANKDITSISYRTVTVTAHGYSTGDRVYIGGRFFIVGAVTTDTFVASAEAAGDPVPDAEATICARVLTITTPYQEEDLFDLHYAQSADVITLTHPDYAVRELARINQYQWTLSTASFAPPAGVPANVTATPTIASSDTDKNKTYTKYKVTAVKDDGVTESLPSISAQALNNLTLAGNFNTISWTGVDGYSRYNVYKLRGGVYGYIGQVSATGATPKTIATASSYSNTWLLATRVRVVTTTSHGYSTGDKVLIEGTNYFDGLFQVEVENSTTFTYAKSTLKDLTVTGGTSSIPSFSLVDDNVQADTTQSPPEDIIALNAAAGDYPATSVYHEQRRWFAGTNSKPQVVWATRSGTDSNLTSSIPSRDADGMELRVASRQYNQIRHLVALSDLIALTAGGEFRLFADGAPAITPTSISIKPQGYSGASNVQPVLTTGSVIYVQAQGSRIRELSYSWEANSYKTTDATIMAPHRFNSHVITDLAYSRAPESIVWAVRDDGVLMAMTYVPDQQVYGWHAHDTDGEFESVCVVSEGNEDVLYVSVKRYFENLGLVRYIERMSTRFFYNQDFAYYVDCGSTFKAEHEGEIAVTEKTITTDTPLIQAEILNQDADVRRSALFSRKVGNELWVFDSYIYRNPSTGISIDGAYPTLTRYDSEDNLISRTQVPEMRTTDVPYSGWLVYPDAGITMDDLGPYSLLETSTHFWLFGIDRSFNGCAVSILKSNPSTQTKYAIGNRASVGFPANDGISMWIKTNDKPHSFSRWSTVTHSYVETRTGPDFRLEDETHWTIPRNGAKHLANGEIVYTEYLEGRLSKLIFLAANGSYTDIDIPYLDVPAVLGMTDDASYVWLVTDWAILKVNVNTKAIVQSVDVDGISLPLIGVGGVPASGYRAAIGHSIVYDSERKVFYWFNMLRDEDTFWPKLVTFDAENFQLVSSEIYPFPHRVPPTDQYTDYAFELAVIDDRLISGGFLSTAALGEWVTMTLDLNAPKDRVFVLYWEGQRYEFTVLTALSPTRALIASQQPIPDSLYAWMYFDKWYEPVTTVSGLYHLEGATVQILADGAVHPDRVVVNGSITLEYPASIVTIGLPYTSDLKTLPLAVEGAAAMGQGTMKNVNRVHLRVAQSSVVKVGPNFEQMREYPPRQVTDRHGFAPALRDGELAITVDPSWNTDAAICVRMDQPLPLTIVSMTLDVQGGG